MLLIVVLIVFLAAAGAMLAFMKALDLLNREMCSVFHRRIAMVIEKA